MGLLLGTGGETGKVAGILVLECGGRVGWMGKGVLVEDRRVVLLSGGRGRSGEVGRGRDLGFGGVGGCVLFWGERLEYATKSGRLHGCD